MSLSTQKLRYLNTISHEGKVLVFGIDDEQRIFYTVRQSGFEDTALSDDNFNKTGFEDWKLLNLDKSVPDKSVDAFNKKEWATVGGEPLLRSLYGQAEGTVKSAAATVQLVSGIGHLYVFRLSITNTLLVNRFVLDGIKNELVPKLEVRFRRSQKKFRPDMGAQTGKSIKTRTPDQVDSLDFRDMNNKPFYEPALELSFIKNLSPEKGWFSVVLLKTFEHEKYRWNIFVYDTTANNIVLYTARASEEGLFDLKNYTIIQPDPNNSNEKLLRNIPGIIKRRIVLENLTVANGFSATAYNIQKERSTKAGMQLLKEATRVMLAVPVQTNGQGEVTTAAISFAAANDGTLSQIDTVPDSAQTLRSNNRDILLPLNTLDEIKVIADRTPPPSGTIRKMGLGENDLLQIYSSDTVSDLKNGNQVKITGTKSYNGHYIARNITDEGFEIEAAFDHDEPGFWEVTQAKETGLVFDNMVLSYEKTDEGQLKVNCTSHDLKEGDEVQVSGTKDYDGLYPVRSVGSDTDSFLLNIDWRAGEVLNLKSMKRRGIRFDGHGDYIRTGRIPLSGPTPAHSMGRTLSAWVWLDEAGSQPQLIMGQDDRGMALTVDNDQKVMLTVRFADGSEHHVKYPVVTPLKTWVHYAGIVEYDTENSGHTSLYLCKNGETAENTVTIVPPTTPFHLKPELLNFDGSGDYVTVPGHTNPTKALTAALWAKSSTANWNDSSHLMSKRNAFIIHPCKDSKEIRFYIRSGGTWRNTYFTPDIDIQQWHHYAGTFDGKALRLYIDGNEVSSTNYTGTIEADTGVLAIGRDDGYSKYFNGCIADISAWNKALPQDLIRENMHRRLTGREDGLVGYWPLDDGTTTDYSGNKRHGTLQGNPQWQTANFCHPAPATQTAFTFDGNDDGVIIRNCRDFPTEKITMAFWIKTTTSKTYPTPFSYAAQGHQNAFTLVDAKNFHVFVNSNSASDSTEKTGVSVNDGQWHHVAVTWESATGSLTIYKDGKTAFTKENYKKGETLPAGGTIALAQEQDSVGGDFEVSNTLDGSLSQVGLWAEILTEAEINGIMHQGLTGDEQNLVGAWVYEEGRARDLSPLQIHGEFLGDPQPAALPDGLSLQRYHSRFYLAGNGSTDDFTGKLSDIQVWDCPRSVQEIKDNMYLQLSGTEQDLSGYWRLGGIIKEEIYNFTPDFSPEKADAVVYGDAYVSARELARQNSQGKAVMYRNDDLFAVAQGATYREGFEFRAHKPDSIFMTLADLNNADGAGNKLFQFSYWGKPSRNSEKQISFPAYTVRMSDFEALDNGWCRADCTFTVPEGVSLVRSFEIDRVKGLWTTETEAPDYEWTRIEVRKHRIELVSDSVVEECYTDEVALGVLADNQTALESDLDGLAGIEDRISARRQELLDVIEKIDLHENIARYEREKDELAAELPGLRTEKQNKANRRNELENDPYRFIFHISVKQNGRVLDVPYGNTSNGTNVQIHYKNNPRSDNQEWVFEKQDDTYYRIKNTRSGKYLDIPDPSASKKTNVVIWPNGSYESQNWRLASRGSNYYALINKDGGYALDLADNKNRGNVQLYPYHGKSNQLWKFESTGVVVSHIRNELARLRNRINALETSISNKDRRFERLTDLLASRPSENIADLQSRKTQLISDTNTLDTQLTQANTDFIASLNSLSASPHHMPLIKQDPKELRTYGAKLGFVRPLAGINAVETAEGNVQLAYFDKKGRMQLTDYDATADSRNATFEQWLPSVLRACPDIYGTADKIAVDGSIELKPNQWTVEAWFQYPCPVQSDGNPYGYNVLASAREADDHVVVIRDGKRLGTVVNGFFHDIGHDLEEHHLSQGWHHVAAVGKEAVTRFYIDGEPVGDHEREANRPVRYAMNFDGKDEVAKVKNFPFPSGDFTVACWFRINSQKSQPNPISYATSNNDNSFTIHNPKSLGIFLGGASTDTLQFSLNDGKWHHLAVTWKKTSGTLTVYADGKEKAVVPDFQAGTDIPQGGTLVLAQEQDSVGGGFSQSQAFDGGLSGVSIWRTARSALDIQEGMYTILKGDEDNLVAYWPMNTTDIGGETKLEDKRVDTDNLLHGTIVGTPEVITLDPQCTSDISSLGNASNGGAPFGKLAEVRIWQTALSDEEVAVNSNVLLSGNEPGLAAYYPLAEAIGTAVQDHSAEDQKHGTLTGGNWAGCTARIGNAGHGVMAFDGKGCIEVANSDALNPTDALTLEAWIRPTAVPEDDLGVILQKWSDRVSGNKRQYQLTMTDDQTVVCYFSTDGANYPSVWTSETIELNQWVHVAAAFDGQHMRLYYNGELKRETGQSGNLHTSDCAVQIGGYAEEHATRRFKGNIADVRIWNRARTTAEINANMHYRLRGDEPGLAGYWQLDQAADGTAKDYTAHQNNGTVYQAIAKKTNDLPIAGDSLVTCEYSTVGLQPDDPARKLAMMRRFLAFTDPAGDVRVFPDQRIEELELKWIGNAQFEPTLLGYIEGAPPVPSENLTINYDYDGGAFVQLTQSEDVAYSWMRNKDVAHGLDMNLFVGAGWGIQGGFGITSKISEGKAGLRGSLNLRNRSSKQSLVRASSTEVSSDRLELKGAYETNAKFQHLGSRYVPKNVGYALVVSGMADVFITRMKRSGKMVSYEIIPVEDVPLDINTITFLINPAYTLNGSLDGQVGSQAAEERFYRHVPEMRTQYGSLYPASYFRLKEAYDLKNQIERWDKERESYFVNFDATRTDEGALTEQTADASEYDQYGQTTVNREEDQTKEGASPTEDEVRKNHTESADEQRDQLQNQSQQKQADIQNKINDQDKQAEAGAGFDAWQKRMENLQIRGAKRNIANTYVWDADGGLRSEEQSFANTVEHSIGGTFSINGNIGGEVDLLVSGFKFELQALYAGELTQTMNKTKTTSKGFELDVYLGGIESKGITDHRDYPVQPGEKVDRYRFMSFYLEGNTRHFDDFFNYVVDPEWLMSNDEEARALRQAQAGKPNKCWRVLHRVTYVERPALMGFGTDLRPTESLEVIADDVVNYFDKLEQDNRSLSQKIDQIMLKLNESS